MAMLNNQMVDIQLEGVEVSAQLSFPICGRKETTNAGVSWLGPETQFGHETMLINSAVDLI